MISIVIPSLNEEKYIEHTLKSLQGQDYKGDYEIIVADGGSDDKTLEIAEKYTDKIVVVKEKGISKGRNAGAKVAKGDILLFVDADTVLFFNALTELEKEFRKDDVEAVACPIIPISPLAKDFILYWAFNQFVKASIKRRKAQISGMCFACRKKAFDGVGGYAEHLETGEDFDLSAKLSGIGKIKFTENTFALTSPRRIMRWGRLNGAKKYIKLYLSFLITRKRATLADYENIR